MARVSPPTEEQVRDLVSAIVEGVEPGGPGVPEVEGDESVAASLEAPDTREGDVAVGADHGGFGLKRKIAADLKEHGFSVVDLGTGSSDSVDYPDFAHAVARAVADGSCRWGIVVDGAGIGSSIVANKVPGIRAALCYDISSARNSREHNHANVLTLGAGLIGETLALQIVRAWLSTPWGGGRHARRVSKIGAVERRYLQEGAA